MIKRFIRDIQNRKKMYSLNNNKCNSYIQKYQHYLKIKIMQLMNYTLKVNVSFCLSYKNKKFCQEYQELSIFDVFLSEENW